MSAAAGAAPRGADDRARSAADLEPLKRLLFALLVLACIGAFFLTQHLKHSPTAVQQFRLTPFFIPGHAGPHEDEAISFKLRRADRVTVRIVNSSLDTVATLVRDHPLAAYKTFSLRWNGRRGTAHRFETRHSPAGLPQLFALPSGRFASPGEYRIEVALRRQKKTVRSSRSFTLQRR